MRRKTVWVVTGIVLIVGLADAVRAADGWGTNPKGKPTNKKLRPTSAGFSDELVADAIKKGVEYLKSIQQPGGHWGPHGNKPAPGKGGHYYPIGPTAMVAYALMESGQVRYDEPQMKKTLDWLAKWQAPPRLVQLKPGKSDQEKKRYRESWERVCHKTYSLGLRANAWLAAVKQGGRAYRVRLRQDAKHLILSTKDGSYGYDSRGQRMSSGDNSNSQYGVLGVWAAAQVDEEVPRQYWYMILKHWVECIAADGGWGYRPGNASTATMTTAGLATLFVCYDNLLADGFVKCDQGERVQAVLRPLTSGLNWMDKYYQRSKGSVSGGAGHGGRGFYLLYGVERVGLASGYKYFGQADWYKLGATWLVRNQNADGSWPGGYGPAISTSYALLFLIRGRHAVLFNKLEFKGDWNNRPRDLAGLCRWVGREFEETTVNWQIINLKVPPSEWHDAPILYISASKAPQLTPADIDKLRTYVHQGGTILSCTECGGKGFSEGIMKIYKKMFPDYKPQELPKDHLLYTINFQLGGYPGFRVISNGVRPLVVHTDTDLPKSWQLRMSQSDKKSFQAPTNVAMYVTGKALAERALAARGAHTWPAEPKGPFTHTVKIARLKYNNNEGKSGNFDPEPLAWQRFSRLMGKEAKVKVDVIGPIEIKELAASGAKLAVLSGTDQIAASAEEKKALSAFIAGDGLLLLEAAGGSSVKGGSRAFAESAQVLAGEIAAGAGAVIRTPRLRRLTINSPIFQQPGRQIKSVGYRRYTRVVLQIKDRTPMLRAVIDTESNPRIIYSAEDITGGLIGSRSFEIHGYTSTSAYQLMRAIAMSKAKALPKAPAKKPAGKPKPRR